MAGWLSPRTRGSRRRWVGFPHGWRRDLPRTAGWVSRGRRRELRMWRVAFPANGGQRAWVSSNPASLSQRQSGGLELEAGRRALSQRQAGGHWVRGRPAGIDSAAGRWARVSRGRRRRHLLRTVGWLIRERRRELPRMAGWLSRERRRQLPRTAGWLSHERRRELPRTAGWESRERRRKLPRTRGHEGSGTKHRNNQKTWKNEQNKTRWRDDAYCLVWSSVTVHTAGRNEEHADEDITSK